MMRRTILVLTAVSGMALTSACVNSPERVTGEAAPVGGVSPKPSSARATPSSAPGSAPPTSPVASPPTSPSPRSSTRPVLVLGPTGLGKLKIGMSPKAATATGEIDAPVPQSGCGAAVLTSANSDDVRVIYSAERGLVAIPAYGRIATPEGIRLGSTVAQVKAAYSDFVLRRIGEDDPVDIGNRGSGFAYAGQNDGYANVHYRFRFKNGKLTELGLEHDRQNCYE